MELQTAQRNTQQTLVACGGLKESSRPCPVVKRIKERRGSPYQSSLGAGARWLAGADSVEGLDLRTNIDLGRLVCVRFVPELDCLGLPGERTSF